MGLTSEKSMCGCLQLPLADTPPFIFHMLLDLVAVRWTNLDFINGRSNKFKILQANTL